jgi:glycosyltransferase involved in cell wall biosynthesis
MRVVFLSHNAQAGDAVGNQLAAKVRQFVGRGWEVRALVESDLRLHPALRPYVETIPPGRPTAAALDYLANADLVVIEFSQYFALLDWLPAMVNKRPRIVFDYHGVTPRRLWPDGPFEALAKGARQRAVVWFADFAVVHSRYMRRELVRATGFPARRVVVVPHAIDTAWFTPGDGPGLFRRRLGLERATVLTFVGRLAPNKRLPVLAEALARLVRAGTDAHALIAGDDGGPYGRERERCEGLARRLGVGERVHFLGHVSDGDLREVYRSGDVFVMPSRHEGYCVPVAEAAACGVPVVAAHATALPETVAGRGLTFRPDDASDLAAKIREVLNGRWPSVRVEPKALRRVAIVTPRYGPDVIGGFETSVRMLAECLHEAGHHVEVHTTRMRAEDDWSNARGPARETVNGVPVVRHDCDPADRQRYWAVDEAVSRGYRCSPRELRDYLRHSVNSSALLQALRERAGDFDTVIAGPYRAGLTWKAAELFADKLLLLPCFHDEPAARLRAYRDRYNAAAGVLYHSESEKHLAESVLGITAPEGRVIGTWIDPELPPGGPERGRRLAGAERYLLYCGRTAEGKQLRPLDRLAERLQAAGIVLPIVLIGPKQCRDERNGAVRSLGRVGEQAKRDLMAGALALVQLSRCESLSLVTLEAWSQCTPVIGNARCRPVAANIQRSGGGRAVSDGHGLLACVRDLMQSPARWRAMGESGRAFVRSRYGSRADYLGRVRAAFGGAGPEGFADAVLRHLRRLRPRRLSESIDLKLTPDGHAVITNRGTVPVLAEGAFRTVIKVKARLHDGGIRRTMVAIPGVILPGRTGKLSLPIDTAAVASFTLSAHASRAIPAGTGMPPARCATRRVVRGVRVWCGQPALDPTRTVPTPRRPEKTGRLARRMERLRSLPTAHADPPAAGVLQSAKARVKHLILNSFKRLFAIPTNLQQSEFNRLTLRYLRHLTRLAARRR